VDTPDASFAECLARLSDGDQGAAREIYEKFVGQLVALAARKLDPRLGAKADPETVAHSALESFFVRHRAGTVEVHNWGMVFGLLAHITVCKALNRNRFHRQQRRDETAAVGIEDWQAVAGGPSPADEAAVAELLDTALKGFGPEERAVLDAYLGGEAATEVANRVGLSTRTVQRILERFRRRLLELMDRE
jgi:RNA polymerase sigma-70 factor (ECF subfamily)